jgi:hypothetical protein
MIRHDHRGMHPKLGRVMKQTALQDDVTRRRRQMPSMERVERDE